MSFRSMIFFLEKASNQKLNISCSFILEQRKIVQLVIYPCPLQVYHIIKYEKIYLFKCLENQSASQNNTVKLTLEVAVSVQ